MSLRKKQEIDWWYWKVGTRSPQETRLVQDWPFQTVPFFLDTVLFRRIQQFLIYICFISVDFPLLLYIYFIFIIFFLPIREAHVQNTKTRFPRVHSRNQQKLNQCVNSQYMVSIVISVFGCGHPRTQF